MAEHAVPVEPPRKPQHADGPLMLPSDPSHRAAVAHSPEPGLRARHRRRVTTEPPAGSDPNPEPEVGGHAATENDERLKRDKPPHWG